MMKLVIENDSQHEINDNVVMGYDKDNALNDDHSPLIINDNKNNENLNEFDDNGTMPTATATTGQNLVPCTLCNRKFLANRLVSSN